MPGEFQHIFPPSSFDFITAFDFCISETLLSHQSSIKFHIIIYSQPTVITDNRSVTDKQEGLENALNLFLKSHELSVD